MEDFTIRSVLKLIIAEGGLFMLILWGFVAQGLMGKRARRLFDLVLVLLAVAAGVAYFEFGHQRYGRYMNPHDCYHYYMGAKYSQEHGYFDLYRCSLVADMDMKRVYREKTIRDLNEHDYEPVSQVMANAARYRGLFSEARWAEFKRDIAYFQSVMPAAKWNRVLRDKGYNATPVWNSIAHALTNAVPTSSAPGMRMLTYIDLALLAVAFMAIWGAFGWRAMLLAIMFHGTNYFMAHVHIKGAILRLDWLMALVFATCLLKRQRYAAAGAFVALGGMARVFPYIFAFGIGVKALLNGLAWLRDRVRRPEEPVRFHRGYLAFFLALIVVSVGLVGASAAYDGGFHLWSNFAQKIAVHNQDISTNRLGFKYIFTWGAPLRATYFQDHAALWRGLLLAGLLAVAAAARKAADWETVPLSFVPVFFLAAPTFYYYVMLLVPFLLALGSPQSGRHLACGVLLFLYSSAAFVLDLFLPHHFLFFFCASIGALLVSAWLSYTTARGPGDGSTRARVAYAMAPALALLLIAGATALPARETPPARETETPAAKVRKDPALRTLVFVGDVMLSRNVARSIERRGVSYADPFEPTSAYLQEADLAFCNLESAISGRGEQLDKRYTFNAHPRALAGLRFAGFNVVSLANNHILDYGPTALRDTERYLGNANILATGLATNEAPQEPAIVELDGIRVGVLAYCDPDTPYAYAQEFEVFERRPAKGTRENLARDIAALRPKVDIIVVSLHWDVEYQDQPTPHSVDLGRFIIDQGAHIIAGHHPHVQQEPEAYRHGLIIHSMGNFVFDQHTRPKTRISRIYRVRVAKDGLVDAEYLPCEIEKDPWRPVPQQTNFVPVRLAG